MKKVSIIVPVWNVEKYLSKCLNSLVHQTLKDIEIVVVNDGSPDNSQEIIDKFVKKYPNKVVSYIKENGGLSSARNFGIKKATGEYIGFVDSDDFVDKDLYEKMYNQAKKQDADVVGCRVAYIYKDKTNYQRYNEIIYNKSVTESPKILLGLKSYAPNKIYKRHLWDKFEFPIQYFEDSAVVYNVLLKANRVAFVSDSFYYYNRLNEVAITKIADNRIYDIFKSCDSILNFYKKNKCYEQTKKVVDEVCIGHIRYRMMTYIGCNDIDGLVKFVDYSNKYLDEKIPEWRKNKTCRLTPRESIRNNIHIGIFKSKRLLNLYVKLHNLKHKLKRK